MSIWFYVAIKNRQEVKGSVEAPSEQEAAKTLRSQGLFVISIRMGGQTSATDIPNFSSIIAPKNWLPVKKQAFVQLYRQLSLMLTSGHTLLEALDLSARLATRRRLRNTLLEIRSQLQRGESFAQALEKHPKYFPAQVIELVRSAEASGELDHVLLRLASDLERSLETRRELVTSMILPAVLVVATIVLLFFMAIWVLPKLVRFIEGRDVAIPASTAAIILLSNFLVVHGATLMVAITATVFLIMAAYSTIPGKRMMDSLFLRLPFLGTTIIHLSIAQAGWTLSMLAAGGVTILDSLKICSHITNNETLKQSFKRAAEKVLAGNSLSVALKQPKMPELFYRMAAVGEKSGELDRVMDEIGNYYNKELQAGTKRFLALLQPIMTLLIGIPIGFVILSIYQLIFAASTGGR